LHIIKIIDVMPKNVEELKAMLQSYTITVNNENLKKIVGRCQQLSEIKVIFLMIKRKRKHMEDQQDEKLILSGMKLNIRIAKEEKSSCIRFLAKWLSF